MILTTSTIWSTTGSQEAPSIPSDLSKSRGEPHLCFRSIPRLTLILLSCTATVEAGPRREQVRPPKRSASLPPAPPLRVIRAGSFDHTDRIPIVASTNASEAIPNFRTQRAVPIMSIIADDQKRRRLEPTRPTLADEDIEPIAECQKLTGSTAQSQLRELLQASRLRRLELLASEQTVNSGSSPIVIAPGAQRAGASSRLRIFSPKTLEPGTSQEPVDLGSLIECDVPIITLTELDDFTFEERMTRQLTLTALTHVSSLPVRPAVPCWMRPNAVLDGPNAVRSPIDASGRSTSIRMSGPSRGPINKRLLCPPPADARGRANFHGRWWSRKNMGYERPAPRRTQSCSGINLPTLKRLAAASAARRPTLDGRPLVPAGHSASSMGTASNPSSTDFKIITTVPSDTVESHKQFQMGTTQVHVSESPDKSLADETLEELGNVLSQSLSQGGHHDLHLARLGPKRVPSTFASRMGTREAMSPLETLQLVLDAQQRLQETYSEGHPVPLPMHELSSRRGAVSGSSYSLIASSPRRDSQDSDDSVSDDGGLSSSSSGSDSESEDDEVRDAGDSSLANDFDSILVVDQETASSTELLFAVKTCDMACKHSISKIPVRPVLTRGSLAYTRT